VEPLTPTPPKEPEAPRRKGRSAGRIGAVAATLAAFALKFKTIVAVLLQFKWALLLVKVLASSWTLVLTLWLYAVAFGWEFGLLFVLLILAHELGHYAAFRAYGLPVRLPVFVPFLGAFTAGTAPQDPEHSAYIALAGPLVGFGLAAACYAMGVSLHERFWLAAASVGSFLNLFNMIPIVPFDGGRVVFSGRAVRTGARYAIFAWYLAVVAGLAVVMWQTYSALGAYR
jgi:Zn-dependent protease